MGLARQKTHVCSFCPDGRGWFELSDFSRVMAIKELEF